jgi:hypothetical protein
MIAFRRAQIAGSQAARVDNNFLHATPGSTIQIFKM